jgi:hypothetical protein
MTAPSHRLVEIDWPDFGGGERPPPIALDELEEPAVVPPFFLRPDTVLALEH